MVAHQDRSFSGVYIRVPMDISGYAGKPKELNWVAEKGDDLNGSGAEFYVRRTGNKGTVRHFANATGSAGILFRILNPGDIGDGDIFRLFRRPNPKWRLDLLCQMIMPLQAPTCLSPKWNGSKAELDELCDLTELAGVEWRDVFNQVRELGLGDGVCVEALSGDGTLECVGYKKKIF